MDLALRITLEQSRIQQWRTQNNPRTPQHHFKPRELTQGSTVCCGRRTDLRASEPVRATESNRSLVRLHHTQELCKKRAKAVTAARLKSTIEGYSAARRPNLPHRHINANNGFCRRCRLHHPSALQVGKHATRMSYGDLYTAKQELRSGRLKLAPMEEELGQCRQELYYWNQLSKAAKSPHKSNNSGPELTVPDWSNHAED
jgi:hypothetical protein